MKNLKLLIVTFIVAINYNSVNAQANTIVQTTPGSGSNTIPGPVTIQGITAGEGGGGSGSNVAFGQLALSSNTTGFANTAVGFDAQRASTGGKQNTAFGAESLEGNNNTGNSAVGFAAMENASGDGNCALGTNTLQWNTGSSNNAFGGTAMEGSSGALVSGSSNCAFGSAALVVNSTGGSNNAFGNFALEANDSGNYNVAIGTSALSFLKGANNNFNVALGYNALVGVPPGTSTKLVTGTNNVAIGAYSTVPVSGNAASNELSIQNVIYGTNMGSTSTGLIGIGTNAPTEQLHTTAGVRFAGVTTGGTVTNLVGIDVSGKLWRYALPSGGIMSSCTSVGKVPYTNATNGNLDCSNIYYDGSSNVGIGTTSPGATLDVNGTLILESLPSNPYPVNTVGVTALVIDASGNVYKGIQEAYRPAVNNSDSFDSLTSEVNDLKTQVNNLRSLVELMIANNNNSSSNQAFTVYPNPAKNEIQIEPNIATNNITSQYAEIRDISNNVVVPKTSFTGSTSIALSNSLSSGTYFVVIYENGKVIQTQKIEIVK